MATLEKLDANKHGYFMLPKEPIKLDLMKKMPHAGTIAKRNKRSLNRKQFLKALGSDAAKFSSNREYSSKSRFRIALLYFHPDILDTCSRTSGGKLQLVTGIQATLAHLLS